MKKQKEHKHYPPKEIFIRVKGLQCGNCSHQWIPEKKPKPFMCPKCKCALSKEGYKRSHNKVW